MDIEFLRDGMLPKGYQKISVSDSPIGLDFPSGSNYAIISVENGGVRFRDDGVNPTNNSGFPIGKNQNMSLYTENILRTIRFVRSSSVDSIININFYQI